MDSNGKFQVGDFVIFKADKLSITRLTKGKIYRVNTVGGVGESYSQTISVICDDGIQRLYWANNFVYAYVEEDV